MRRRDRMGLRQPGVQRDQTRLHAEADEDQREGQLGPERRQLGRAHGGEGEPTAERGQHTVTQQDAQPADMRHQQIQKGGTAIGRLLMLEGDQKIRRQGHQLPGDHEQEGIVGQHDQQHAGQEQSGEAAERDQGIPALLEAAHIGRAVDPDGTGYETDQEQEEPGERIETKVPRQPRQSQRQDRRRRIARQQGTQSGRDRRHAREPYQRHRQKAHHPRHPPRRQRCDGRRQSERHRQTGHGQGGLDGHGVWPERDPGAICS